MPIQKHVHRLRRHKYQSTRSFIYFCVLDCDYKISPSLAVGKKSICNRCGKEFILNEYSVRLAKPHCEDCHKIKPEKISAKDAKIILESNDTVAPIIANVFYPQVKESLADRLSKAINEIPVPFDEEEEI